MNYPHDVSRLVAVAARRGFILDPMRARAIWDLHSDHYAAGWLSMDRESDADLWRVLESLAGEV